MAPPHLLAWSILILWLLIATPQGSAAYTSCLWILLLINTVSLAFDTPEAFK